MMHSPMNVKDEHSMWENVCFSMLYEM